MEKELEKIEKAVEYIMYNQHGYHWCKEDSEWETQGHHNYD